MWPVRAVACAAVLGLALTGVVGVPWAAAEYDEYAMNGTFSVVSNGELAQMNERYQDKPTVRSTWTVSTACSTPITCGGKVTSSLGWTEDIYTTTGQYWYVRHSVPNWIPCPDGTSADGQEVFSFYPGTEAGTFTRFSDLWLGQDETTGVSGNCGRNKSLVLTMPVKISRIG